MIYSDLGYILKTDLNNSRERDNLVFSALDINYFFMGTYSRKIVLLSGLNLKYKFNYDSIKILRYLTKIYYDKK